MQTVSVAEQMTLLDLDTSCGKMFREHCLREKTQTESLAKEQTSKPSSRKSSKLSNQPLPMCLCLRGADGQSKDAYMEWESTESPFPWLTRYTMHSTTVCHKDGKDSAFWLISTDSPQPGFCLTLNLSERPRVENPTLLSEVLEEEADAKYKLSAKACRGILNRASKRGKQLPSILQEALENQIRGELDGQTEIANS